MIAFYGTLVELKKCNLLDCVTYLGGVSGSTWCMSNLYRHENWTEKVEFLEQNQREKLIYGSWDISKAEDAVLEAARDEDYSLTDFWAYVVVYSMLTEIDQSTLSDQQRSLETGKNPYPIYAAVDKRRYSGQLPGSWFEFSPHEVGAPGVGGAPTIGGYVDVEHFGSAFRNGQLIEEKKKKTICYLQGLWGSALASEKEILKTIIDFFRNLLKLGKEKHSSSAVEKHWSFHLLSELYEYVLELRLCASASLTSSAITFFDAIENTLKNHRSTKSYKTVREIRQVWSTADAKTQVKACLRLWEVFSNDSQKMKVTQTPSFDFLGVGDWFIFICKTTYCILTWTWGSTRNFLCLCEGIKIPELKREDVVSLIDAGLAINTAYPLILHPGRNVKLILSFDFSSGDPFETLKRAVEYCKINGIKFPMIDDAIAQDVDKPSDCYVFRGDGLTVMHFPLLNKGNCQDKIAEYRKMFQTFKLSYTGEEIDTLLSLAKKNVTNVQKKIVDEIKRTVGSSS
uniref:PLA2c domain-containing protein n=1 Tax=Salvator merianae TaxID=96440 RepID=A0A8D0E5G0_SALMN